MNPPDAARDDPGPAIDERVDSEMAQFVAAGGHEHHVSRRLRLTQDSHQLQPARKASASFAGTPVPAASRRHDHERRQRWIGARDLCGDVEGLDWRPLDVRQHLDLDAPLRLLLQPARQLAAHLQHRRTEWLRGTSRHCSGTALARPPRVTQTIALWRFSRRASPSGPAPAAFGIASASPISASLPSAPSRPRTPRSSVNAASNSGIPSMRRSPTVSAAGQNVNALKRERFERSGQTGLLRFLAEPVRGGAIDRGAGPMEALFLEGMDDPANAAVTKRCSRILCGRALWRRYTRQRVQGRQLKPLAATDRDLWHIPRLAVTASRNDAPVSLFRRWVRQPCDATGTAIFRRASRTRADTTP